MNEIFQRGRDRTIAIEKGGNNREMMTFDYLLYPKEYNMLVYFNESCKHERRYRNRI